MCKFPGGQTTVLNIAFHNFQRRMSRLEQRWRAQRSVINIVNCRIPWTNRDLNVYCAFGISLKACLLQCLYLLMPVASCSFLVLAACAYLCVRLRFRVRLTHWACGEPLLINQLIECPRMHHLLHCLRRSPQQPSAVHQPSSKAWS